MSNLVDINAAALTALVLSARTIAALHEKGILGLEEAAAIVTKTAAEISSDDPAQKEACRAALQTVFPGIPF